MTQTSPAATTPPGIELSSGHVVYVRRIAPTVIAQLNANAAQALEAERPQPPADPTAEDRPAYEQALAAWSGRVREQAGVKMMQLFTTYVVLNEVDTAAVQAYREALAALGVTITESDREIYCWSILAPTMEDQQRLFAFAVGMSPAASGA